MGLPERLVDQALHVAEAAWVWIGTELGWYAALRDRGPATAAELAARTGTAERYAREWLEQQAVAGLLTRAADRYELPPGHAAALLDADDPDRVEPFVRQMLVAARRLPEIAAAARTGGGVPWSAYGPEMSKAQGDGNRPALHVALPTTWVPQLPDLEARLRAGARVLEVGCGEGWAAVGLAEHFPGVTVLGVDVDETALAQARQHAEAAGVADRVTFATTMPAGGYDVGLAVECVHDMPYPAEVLAALRTATTGPVYVIDEAADPELTTPGDEIQRLLYGFSLLICLPDSLSHPGSAGTGTVIRPATLDRYAKEAGFHRTEARDVTDMGFWRCYELVR